MLTHNLRPSVGHAPSPHNVSKNPKTGRLCVSEAKQALKNVYLRFLLPKDCIFYGKIYVDCIRQKENGLTQVIAFMCLMLV